MSFSSHIEFHIAFFLYYHSKKNQKVYEYLARNEFQALCIDLMFKVFSGV